MRRLHEMSLMLHEMSLIRGIAAMSLGLMMGIALSGCSASSRVGADDPQLSGPASVSQSRLSQAGPSVGSLRHRDRMYDLRTVITSDSTGANDAFIRQFNQNRPTASLPGPTDGSLDARTQVDAVAVEDDVLMGDQLIGDIDR